LPGEAVLLSAHPEAIVNTVSSNTNNFIALNFFIVFSPLYFIGDI